MTHRSMDVRHTSTTTTASAAAPLLKRQDTPPTLVRNASGNMKRIRRRPKRTGSNRSNNSSSSMRRSISHPPSRHAQAAAAVLPIPRKGNRPVELQPLVVTTTNSSTDALSACSDDNYWGDLEAGCPTKEGAKTTKSSNVAAHKKNDDDMTTTTTTTTTMKSLRWISVSTSRLWQHAQRLRHDAIDFWHVIPLFVKLSFGTQGLTCCYCVYILYRYYTSLCGSLCATVPTTFVALAFAVTFFVTVATIRTSHMELMEVMTQQIKSRAILNTLYPTRVLEQMYKDVTPEQYARAQDEIQQHLDEKLSELDPEVGKRREAMSDESLLLHQVAEEQKIQHERQRRKQSFQNSLNSFVDGAALCGCSIGSNGNGGDWGNETTQHTSNNNVQNNNNNNNNTNNGMSNNSKRRQPMVHNPQQGALLKSSNHSSRRSNFTDSSEDDDDDDSDDEDEEEELQKETSMKQSRRRRQRRRQERSPQPDRKSLGYEDQEEEQPPPLVASSSSKTSNHNNNTAPSSSLYPPPLPSHSTNHNNNMSSSSASSNLPPPPQHDNQHNNNHNSNNNTNTEMMCIRRNSLTLRRKSLTRRASMTQARRSSVSFRRRRSSLASTKSVSSNASSAGTGRPIQERFDPTTVLFADIAGFTQWCSEREPCHVFQLLEAVFFVFDNLAKQLSVYKIETIGDCYVAVTGLPDFLEDHAVAMSLFASQIILEFDQVVAELAVDEMAGGLGHDTSTLRLRVGCHSGPVTAGVLRGDKGRFQLFGDTVNTAARMESNGLPGKVQISEQMAHVLAINGKSHWYTPRDDKITAKGKGELQTYWLQNDLMGHYKRDREQKQKQQKSLWANLEDVLNLQEQHLIDWNFTQLERLVKKIVAVNTAHQMDASSESVEIDWGGPLHYEEHDGTILDELKMNADNSANLIPTSKNTNVKYESVVLSPKVLSELQDFVKAIAENFQNNPFHNFAHSCHMIRSMLQVMDELEKSNNIPMASTNNNSNNAMNGSSHHHNTNVNASTGAFKLPAVLSRDPLAQFVIVLTCMVQDVDNPGVTNEQLMKEDSDMAEYFNKTCLQQQNALDVAWELLVGETCENLLLAICSHSAMELERFRKYMVHAMMATDLEDRDLVRARYKRWNEVSNPHHSTNRRNSRNSFNMGAAPTWLQSIVSIEQSMQLSKQIHAVQTPEFFAQWNQRSFREQYLAYINDRREQDPCASYYEDQLRIFRKVVVPQADRYRRSNSNGRTIMLLGICDELARHARQNLQEWEKTGEMRVRELARAAKYEFGEKLPSAV